MNWKESDIEAIRRVADEMYGSDESVLLPGWDPDHFDEREAAIRTAALGVFGDFDPDSGVVVSEHELGALLRYLIDIQVG